MAQALGGVMPEAKAEAPKAYNASSFAFVRDQWIKDKMKERVSEFTTEQTIRVFLGTWNVNAKKPSAEKGDLADWLLPDDTWADIYVIGYQEIVDLTAVNLVTDHSASKPWEQVIERTLRNAYVQVGSEHLVGLNMVVYVKKDLYPDMRIRDVLVSTVGVGIMGVGGNKGAVAIRFDIYDSTICFVNTHLAAHKGNVQGRNSDYHNIVKKIAFYRDDNTAITLFEHEHVFWIGDLNYRLNLDDLQEVYDCVARNDIEFLLQHDQLLIEKQAKRAFAEFTEGKIDFLPTYKYMPGTDDFDRVKLRFPAWCDRIQWKGSDIKQLYYKRVNLMCSDHKPVCAAFDVKCKILVEEKQKQVHQSIVRELDKWENQSIPKVSLSQNTVQFPQVKFDQSVTRSLSIKNIGYGAVNFRFVPKLEEENYCRPWLNVEPSNGFLPPGQSIDLSVVVHVTRETAQALNTKEELKDIIILRLDNAKGDYVDLFVTIEGEYLKSCFGSTIDYLVKTPAPVRYATPNQNHGKVLSIPKELWLMVDYIYRNGMDDEELFLANGDAEQIDQIRECLDTGAEFKNFDIPSMAETLIQFLSSIADPIFPSEICDQLPENMPLESWCTQALVQLPAAKYNTFVYMISFLREVLKHSKNNGLNADQLVVIFSTCLMHWDHMKYANQNAAGKKSKEWIILRYFLTNNDLV